MHSLARGLTARTLAVIVLVASLAAASAEDSGDATRGTAYLAPFKQDLMAALKAGLAEGPAAAIDACRVEAPEIAKRHSADGVRMGRSSHRLRNPDNAGPAWVSPTLATWLEDADARKPAVVELDDDRIGYIEPIIAQPLCLTCHGESLAPAISERLAALYPDDAATGFSAGDLRGVFWVEFPR